MAAGEEEHCDFDAAQLPPGFRFHPTDEEIIMDYLMKKAADRHFMAAAIGEADLNKCEPWELPKKSKLGEKEWFFFFQRDRKYPTGTRTNRATDSGYWKATGKDKEIIHKGKSCLVGMKKTLVFYKGRAPHGVKADWVMHEYRLEGNHDFPRHAKEEWVVCRVFHKNTTCSSTGNKLPRVDPNPPLIDYNESFAQNNHPLNSWSSSCNSLQNNILYSQTTPTIPDTASTSQEYPFRGEYQRPKMEIDSANYSFMITPPEETGPSNEKAVNYATSMCSRGDIERDESLEQQLDAIYFSNSYISDLDSFWS